MPNVPVSGCQDLRNAQSGFGQFVALGLLALSKHLIARYVQVPHEQLSVTFPLRVRTLLNMLTQSSLIIV
jgi:hypothetical protein